VLRITTQNNSDVTRFIVEGKLAGPCVRELENCWQSFVAKESPEQVVIDLTSVTYVDSCGKELLARMFQEGTRFVGKLLMPKTIIQEIECGQQGKRAS
jgi:anti-anti-sigma factor